MKKIDMILVCVSGLFALDAKSDPNIKRDFQQTTIIHGHHYDYFDVIDVQVIDLPSIVEVVEDGNCGTEPDDSLCFNRERVIARSKVIRILVGACRQKPLGLPNDCVDGDYEDVFTFRFPFANAASEKLEPSDFRLSVSKVRMTSTSTDPKLTELYCDDDFDYCDDLGQTTARQFSKAAVTRLSVRTTTDN